MTTIIPAGGETWRHYKGDLYRVIAVGCLESDPSLELVAYALDNTPSYLKPKVWMRPLSEFQEKFVLEGDIHRRGYIK